MSTGSNGVEQVLASDFLNNFPEVLNISQLPSYLLDRIVDFTDVDARHALQATSKLWYWIVHQSRTHRQAGDVVRLGLLQEASASDISSSTEQDRSLHMLSSLEPDHGTEMCPTFLTKCYLLSVLRAGETIKIHYAERQKLNLSTMIHLLLQLAESGRHQPITIVLLIDSLTALDSIADCLSSLESDSLASHNIVVAVEIQPARLLAEKEDSELQQYLQLAHSFEVNSEAALTALLSTQGHPPRFHTRPLTSLTVIAENAVDGISNADFCKIYDSYPMITRMSLNHFRSTDFHLIQSLLQSYADQVRAVDLSNSEIEAIPILPFKQLSNLHEICLAYCRLQTTQLARLAEDAQHLTILDISNNDFFFFDTLFLHKFLSLEELYLYRCHHIGQETLDELSSLSKLRILVLCYNQFGSVTRLPFEKLVSLEELDVSQCDLQGEDILQGLRGLHALRTLKLQDNDLSSVTRLPLENMTRLQRLIVSRCRILHSGVLEDIWNLQNIKELDLSYNAQGLMEEFRDKRVFERLGDMRRLQDLNLSHCSFDSLNRLPCSNMKRLRHLDLRSCLFKDEIALVELGNLQSLQTLMLARSDLSCMRTLPFDGFRSLEDLDLEFCQLHGEHILDGLQNLPKLRYLYLRGNNLESIRQLPFANLKGLEDLGLSYCKLAGEDILDGLADLTTLKELDLSSNDLSSIRRLPFKSLTSLVRLELLNTKLDSQVVSQGLQDLKNLQHLAM